MGKGLSAAQRKAVREADPATGRLGAGRAVCAALVAAGLAVPHGRGGRHYLTAEGRRLRAELAAPQPAQSPEPDRPAPPGGSFTADDGTGTLPPRADPARRAAEVAAAWQGLLQIRAVLMDGETGRPAPWERERPVHAVALALEATGCPPARPGTDGYRVADSPHPGATEVRWTGTDQADAEAALTRCAARLAGHGWQPTRHRTRDRTPYLLVTPATR